MMENSSENFLDFFQKHGKTDDEQISKKLVKRYNKMTPKQKILTKKIRIFVKHYQKNSQKNCKNEDNYFSLYLNIFKLN